MFAVFSPLQSLLYKKVHEAQFRSHLANEMMMYHMKVNTQSSSFWLLLSFVNKASWGARYDRHYYFSLQLLFNKSPNSKTTIRRKVSWFSLCSYFFLCILNRYQRKRWPSFWHLESNLWMRFIQALPISPTRLAPCQMMTLLWWGFQRNTLWGVLFSNHLTLRNPFCRSPFRNIPSGRKHVCQNSHSAW